MNNTSAEAATPAQETVASAGPGYSKIDTLYVRGEDHRLTDELRNPVYGSIATWRATEKIDGTNVRVHLTQDDEVRIGGRTDRAQLPPDLIQTLAGHLTPERLAGLRLDDDPTAITLYGEGYGAGIQKGGAYREDKGFILFDVLVQTRDVDGGSTSINNWWLDDFAVTEIAEKLDVPRVPVLGDWSLPELTDNVRAGIPSQVALVEPRQAEGVVARPIEPLLDRRGKRVLLKLKTKDFR